MADERTIHHAPDKMEELKSPINALRAIRRPPESEKFPAPIFTPGKKQEKTKMMPDIPFMGLKRVVLTTHNARKYYLLKPPPFPPGIQKG